MQIYKSFTCIIIESEFKFVNIRYRYSINRLIGFFLYFRTAIGIYCIGNTEIKALNHSVMYSFAVIIMILYSTPVYRAATACILLFITQNIERQDVLLTAARVDYLRRIGAAQVQVNKNNQYIMYNVLSTMCIMYLQCESCDVVSVLALKRYT